MDAQTVLNLRSRHMRRYFFHVTRLNYKMTRMSDANRTDPDQSAQMRCLDSDTY